MKSSTNVSKPGKKPNPKQSVVKTFEKAEEKAEKKLSSDQKRAEEYDEMLKQKAKQFTPKTGRITQKDLAASGSYTGTKAKSYSETERVKGLKQTGFYDAKPAVVGGTKKMIKRSKKNVQRTAASPQAKRAAVKLY